MVRSFLRRWLADEEATTAVEYAVMLALMLVAVIVSVQAVGNSTASGWSNNVNKITSASNAS